MNTTHCFHVFAKVFYTLVLVAVLFSMQVMAVPISAPPVATTHQWTGATSTDWHLASNWDVNTVPASTSVVFIHAAPVNQPVVTTTVSIADLNNEAGSLLTLKSIGAFTVANGFTNNGTITLGPWFGTAGLFYIFKSGVS